MKCEEKSFLWGGGDHLFVNLDSDTHENLSMESRRKILQVPKCLYYKSEEF